MAAPGIAVNRVSILHNMSGRRFLARRSERDLAITYTTFRYPVLVNQIIELFDDAIQKQMRFHRGIVLSQAKQPSPPPPPLPGGKDGAQDCSSWLLANPKIGDSVLVQPGAFAGEPF